MSLPEPANNEAEAFRRHNAALEAERRRVWREETAARILAAIVLANNAHWNADELDGMVYDAVNATNVLRAELDKEPANA